MTLIKICGITCIEDALIAVKAGADIIGLIVEVPVKTPRNLNRNYACKIAEAVKGKIDVAAVVMPQHIEEALEIANKIDASIIQIHSELPIIDLEKLVDEAHNKGLNVFKTFSVHGNDRYSLLKQIKVVERIGLDLVLLDFAPPQRFTCSNSDIIDLEFTKLVKGELKTRLGIAGGLDVNNVAYVLREIKPDLIDASSRLEASPGRKDPAKVNDFIKKIRGYLNENS
jgi:phosphoribosylanthranilate isomerase